MSKIMTNAPDAREERDRARLSDADRAWMMSVSERELAQGKITIEDLIRQVKAKEMQAAIALRPDYGQAYFMLGTALKQKGDRDGAERALRMAIRLDPGDPGPYNTLGQLLRQKGDLEGSKEAFAKGEQVKQVKEAELGKMLQRKDTVK